jgi:hypothetical protein
MALVIVRLPGWHAGSQRQNRLSPIQSLHLTLLVHAQHDGAVRRIQVQAHDIPNLLDELRVFREFEVLDTMRLQPKVRQMRTIAVCDRPVCFAISRVLQCVLWHRFQGLGYDLFDLPIRDLARSTDPRLIQQSFQPELPKPLPPRPLRP